MFRVPAMRRHASVLRAEVVVLLEVWALCGLAIAQPLLEVTGRSPDFFLFHRASTAQILLLVAAVTALPPLVLWAAGAATALAGRRTRRVVHVLTIAVLCAVLAVEGGKWLLPLRGLPLAAAAVAFGATVAVVYLRWSAVAKMLRVAAVGPIVFVVLFAVASPSSALVLGRSASLAPPAPVAGPHPPLVVIVLDELAQVSLLDDSGRLDAVRFPNFARLAANSTWFRNATTVSGYTPYAVPSLLTGKFPARKAAPHYSMYPNNLFTLLAGTYDLEVQESIVQLCPPRMCARTATSTGGGGLSALLLETASLLEQVVSPMEIAEEVEAGFTEPTVGGTTRARTPDPTDVRFRFARNRDNQPVRFQAFVDGLRSTSRPTVHFLHLLLPHQPFRYLPSGTRYERARGLPREDGWWARLAHQRHILQARYTDVLLGQAITAMQRSGLYDRAVVVVTSDHGIAFASGAAERKIDKSQRSAAEIGWVPLFIKAPGQRHGRVDQRNWLHVDLLPTLADYAGVTIPWRVDGRSALRAPRPTAEKPYFFRPGTSRPLDPDLYRTAVLRGPDDTIRLPAVLFPDLAGKAASILPIRDSDLAASVVNKDAFANVGATDDLPALVRGGLPPAVPAGRHLAIALNGTIATVVPVLPAHGKDPRFAGLITDERLFRAGTNRLELFLLGDGGTTLQRLRL